MKKGIIQGAVLLSLLTLAGCGANSTEETKSSSEVSSKTESSKESNVSMETVEEKINNEDWNQALQQLEELENQGDKKAKGYIAEIKEFQKVKDLYRKGKYAEAKKALGKLKATLPALKDQKDQLSDKISEKLAQEQEKTNTEKATTQNKNQSKTITPKSYSMGQMEAMNAQFLNWAIPRAKTAKMAVTDAYNVHGAISADDLYINTPDGKVLIQGNYNPNVYVGEAVAGLIFCHAKDGVTGELPLGGCTATTFENVEMDEMANKYILASNGVVYELKGPASEIVGVGGVNQGSNTTSLSGNWIVSEDAAAQQEAQNILSQY